MRRKYSDDRLKFYIGDVIGYDSIMNAIREGGLYFPFCRS